MDELDELLLTLLMVDDRRIAGRIGRPAWHRQAACRGQGTDEFFPERGQASQDWRELCAGCPVRTECLEYAVADPHVDGNWAGTTRRERVAMRKASRAA